MFYVDVHFNIFFNGLCFLCPKNLCLFQAQENVSPMGFFFSQKFIGLAFMFRSGGFS